MGTVEGGWSRKLTLKSEHTWTCDNKYTVLLYFMYTSIYLLVFIFSCSLHRQQHCRLTILKYLIELTNRHICQLNQLFWNIEAAMLCKSAVTLFTKSTHFAEPVWVNKLLEFKGSKNIFTFARGLLMMALLSVWTESLLPPTLWYLHTSPQVGCAKCVCVELQSQCVFSRSSTGSSQKPENGSWGANSKHNSDTLTLLTTTQGTLTPLTPRPLHLTQDVHQPLPKDTLH